MPHNDNQCSERLQPIPTAALPIVAVGTPCITDNNSWSDAREQCPVEAEHRGVAGPRLPDCLTKP